MNGTQQSNPVQFSVPPETPAATTTAAMDEALAVLQSRKDAWAACSTQERIAILEQLAKDFHAVAPRIVETEMQCKGANDSDFAYTT